MGHMGRGNLSWRIPPSEWSAGISVEHFLNYWLAWEVTVHCGQCQPQEGGLRLCKKASRTSMKSKYLPSKIPPLFLFELLPPRPSMVDCSGDVYAPLLPKLFGQCFITERSANTSTFNLRPSLCLIVLCIFNSTFTCLQFPWGLLENSARLMPCFPCVSVVICGGYWAPLRYTRLFGVWVIVFSISIKNHSVPCNEQACTPRHFQMGGGCALTWRCLWCLEISVSSYHCQIK